MLNIKVKILRPPERNLKKMLMPKMIRASKNKQNK